MKLFYTRSNFNFQIIFQLFLSQEFEYKGSFDDEGQFHGPAILIVPTNKMMCLRGSCKLASVQEISGTFVNGLLG